MRRSTCFAVLGEPYLDIAFHAARVADPSAVLYLNETFTEFSDAKFDGLLDLAERLLDRGVPMDGIGLQGYFALASPDGARLQAQLERIGALGREVECELACKTVQISG
ncbi:MAG: endo-1,4-beta-xylanase [Halioglobus sp.]|nr:endo-1,4-beta-xylanase [Halioglobus sp.]